MREVEWDKGGKAGDRNKQVGEWVRQKCGHVMQVLKFPQVVRKVTESLQIAVILPPTYQKNKKKKKKRINGRFCRSPGFNGPLPAQIPELVTFFQDAKFLSSIHISNFSGSSRTRDYSPPAKSYIWSKTLHSPKVKKKTRNGGLYRGQEPNGFFLPRIRELRGRSDKYLAYKWKTKILEKWRFISQHSL